MPLNGECSGSGCFSLQCSPGAYIAIKRTKLCLKMIKNHVTKLVRACIFLCRGSLSLNVLTFTCESFSGESPTMKFLGNILLMLLFVTGLAAYGNTNFVWLLICLPLVVWLWRVLCWYMRLPRLMVLFWLALLCFKWPAALALGISVIIVWMFNQRHSIAQERPAKRRQQRQYLLGSYDYDFRTFSDD